MHRPGRPTASGIVYLARVSGNDKLFRLDLASGAKTQLTFGTHDDGGAQFVDDDTLVFPSTALDPNQLVDPEVARNGNIFNLWTLSLKSGELRQYTDTLTAKRSPVVLADDTPRRRSRSSPTTRASTAFTRSTATSRCTRWPARTSARRDRSSTSSRRSAHARQQNARKKGTFEKLFLEGRPPVNVGVTSGGDLFGGTQVTFTDVLGDKQFNMFAASVSQYRTMSFSYINLSRRFQYTLQAYSQTQFYYGYDPGCSSATTMVTSIAIDALATPDGAWRDGVRDLPAQPLLAPRAVRRLPAIQAGIQRTRSCRSC